MPTFSYVTGNPSNLTPSGPASMTDIQGPFTDLRSAINGNLDETNVPNLAAAFTTYKPPLYVVAASLTAGAASATFVTSRTVPADNAIYATGNALAKDVVLDIDPTRYNANIRATKLNLRVQLFTGTTLPGALTFTAGLYPVATYGQDPSFRPRVDTIGTVITGSTAAFASPSPANSRLTGSSGDFNCPAAGAYTIAVVMTGGPMPASSGVGITVALDMRQV